MRSLLLPFGNFFLPFRQGGVPTHRARNYLRDDLLKVQRQVFSPTKGQRLAAFAAQNQSSRRLQVFANANPAGVPTTLL